MEKTLEHHAIELLAAAYRASEYQERRGRRLLLTFLDGPVAKAAGLNPSPRSDAPEGRAYRQVVDSLLSSGAVEIPDIRDQQSAGVTYYEITPRGVEILREAGRIT